MKRFEIGNHYLLRSGSGGWLYHDETDPPDSCPSSILMTIEEDVVIVLENLYNNKNILGVMNSKFQFFWTMSKNLVNDEYL